MKKLYGAVVAVFLSMLFVFAGCKADGDKVLNYLKTTGAFKGESYGSDPYQVTLTVNEDLSYSLNVSYNLDGLKNYKTEGMTMEYLGYDEQEFTSEWLGTTSNNTNYKHVVRLNGAKVEIREQDHNFYLIASTTSKRSDSFYLQLVAAPIVPEDEKKLDYIARGWPSFELHKK